MATREVITTITRNLKGVRRGFNISATVGTRGRNNKGDVMVVQALLQFIAIGSPKLAGDAPPIKKVNGLFNLETDRAIRWFQRRFDFILLGQDGLVHPASFKNRIIKTGGKQMMICQLNYYAHESSVLLSEGLNYTEAIFRKFPQLKTWVNDV